MREGSPEEVDAWVRQLESDAGVAPCWEVLFQAMCCPVPQELKAALDGAIAALARRPELAAALWERLLAAVVVQPMGGTGGQSQMLQIFLQIRWALLPLPCVELVDPH